MLMRSARPGLANSPGWAPRNTERASLRQIDEALLDLGAAGQRADDHRERLVGAHLLELHVRTLGGAARPEVDVGDTRGDRVVVVLRLRSEERRGGKECR